MKGGAQNQEVALKFGAQYTPYIQQGQWYRLFTSMFLHFGFLHLICNMYSLYNLGPSLEYFFGIPIFVVLYPGIGPCRKYPDLSWSWEEGGGRLWGVGRCVSASWDSTRVALSASAISGFP